MKIDIIVIPNPDWESSLKIKNHLQVLKIINPKSETLPTGKQANHNDQNSKLNSSTNNQTNL